MRRFTVQLLLPIVAIVAAFLLVATLYWSRAFEHLYVDSLTERLEREVRLVAEALPRGISGSELDAVARLRAEAIGARVTIVAEDGTVLGESEEPSAALENHGQRPEIREAREHGVGRAVRFSHTVGEAMLYLAIFDDDPGAAPRFVRIATPLRVLRESRSLIGRILMVGFAAAVVAGGGAAWIISRRVVSRVRRIEESSRQIVAGGDAKDRERSEADEIDRLEGRLVELARGLREQLEATEEERAKLEAVLRSMGEGVVVVDAEGRITLCNQRAAEYLEIPEWPECRGEKLAFLCRNPDLHRLLDEALVEGGGVGQREVVFEGLEPPRVVFASVAPGFAEGPEQGAILALHDVTRVRQLEAVRADFVANVSHELRTPLTAIRGYAETLLNGALDDRERAMQFLKVIDRHSQRLARLIDDLLSLSDLELGRTQIHRRAVAVAPLVESVLEMLTPQASARGITLESDVSADLPRMYADRDRIEEVLINLVDNAVKYGRSGTAVAVRARPGREDGEERIELSVTDQGIGIPEKEIPRLTERFYRVDRARSRELGGTGLGLAIVKHIVQAHDGRLRIESRLNVGTTVTVTLSAA